MLPIILLLYYSVTLVNYSSATSLFCPLDIHSFIQQASKHLLSACGMPGTVSGTGLPKSCKDNTLKAKSNWGAKCFESIAGSSVPASITGINKPGSKEEAKVCHLRLSDIAVLTFGLILTETPTPPVTLFSFK